VKNEILSEQEKMQVIIMTTTLCVFHTIEFPIEFAAKRQSSPLRQYNTGRLRGVAAAVGDGRDQSGRRTGGPGPASGEVPAAAAAARL